MWCCSKHLNSQTKEASLEDSASRMVTTTGFPKDGFPATPTLPDNPRLDWRLECYSIPVNSTFIHLLSTSLNRILHYLT